MITLRLDSDPILRRVAPHVDDFAAWFHVEGEAVLYSLEALAEEMRLVLDHEKAAGLAAPQLGISSRVFIVDPAIVGTQWCFVNPRIVWRRGNQLSHEGCLSIPDTLATVKRSRIVTVVAQDVHGGVFKRTYTGFAAVVVQHEYDHLDGILMTDPKTKK